MSETTTTTMNKFDKLTAAERRVAVARDVVAQIKARRILPQQGTYLDLRGEGFTSEDNTASAALAKAKDCTACALGAIFVASVGSGLCDVDLPDALDSKSAPYIPGAQFMHTALAGVFDDLQLAQIECAFESCEIYEAYELALEDDESLLEAAASYFNSDEDPNSETRLVILMENVIRNGGQFVVTDRAGL